MKDITLQTGQMSNIENSEEIMGILSKKIQFRK